MKKNILAVPIALTILLTACATDPKTQNTKETAAGGISGPVSATNDTKQDPVGETTKSILETEQTVETTTLIHITEPIQETEHVPEPPIEGTEYHIKNYTIVRDENGKDWITAYDGDEEDVKFMSWDFTGSLLKISGIGPGLFAGKSIKSFTTNIYFTEIGERAFENCTQLEQVNLMLDYVPADQKLERIGYRAFAGTTSLKSFIFPEDVTFIEPEVLRGSGVQEIRVEGAYEIKSRAFADCSNLTDLYLPVTAMVFADDMLSSYEGLIIHCPQVAKAWEWAKERHIAALAEENIIGRR